MNKIEVNWKKKDRQHKHVFLQLLDSVNQRKKITCLVAQIKFNTQEAKDVYSDGFTCPKAHDIFL